MASRPRKPPAAPRPPAGVSAEARRLWSRTFDEFDFTSAADLALLGQLVETVDRLRGIQREIKRTGLTVQGAQGQTRCNPLLAAEAEARRGILAHVRALRLTSAPEF
jgi:P27 family predicted phage terminase small subunit